MKITVVLLALAAVTQLQVGEQPGAASRSEAELVKRLRPYYLIQAADYRFAPADAEAEGAEPFQLVEKPVMSWTGQEGAGVTSGDVFVWTNSGRAEMIGCIGSTPSGEDRYNFHEFHSLARVPLSGVELGNGRTWASKTAGVELKPIPNAPAPADTDTRRLVEMRQLARQFGARMQSNAGNERLRLLPQPIFRYDTAELKESGSDVVDGAIFAYVWTNGTDPELLLLLECRKTGDGLTWMYAPVRFTYRELWLDHNDAEVWRVGVDAGHDYIGPYVTVGTGVRSLDEIQAVLEAREKEAK
jgi:hypothetical protein